MHKSLSIGNGSSESLDAHQQNLFRNNKRWSEVIIKAFLTMAGIVSIFTTIAIVFELGKESLLFFNLPQVTLKDFLTGTTWQPAGGKFGVLPLVTSTLITSMVAMFVAIPLGLGAAIYLSEYAANKTRKVLKPVLEILAGIPTVVYGYFALTFMTPILRGIFGQDNV